MRDYKRYTSVPKIGKANHQNCIDFIVKLRKIAKNSKKPGVKIWKYFFRFLDMESGGTGGSKFVADIFEKLQISVYKNRKIKFQNLK